MELWLWMINGIMWLIAATLIGFGSWKLSVGLRWLRRAEQYTKGDWFDKAISDFLDIKSSLLDVANRFLDIEEELLEKELDMKDIEQDMKSIKQEKNKVYESLDRVDDSLKNIDEDREFFRNWGNIREITGSRDIALAAAFFAGASVVVGISGVLIALFMN